MTRQRFDHSQCDHEKTKAGRAACRKQMRDAATAESAAKPATPKPGTTPAKKATTPRKTPTKAPATKAAPKSPVKAAETKPAETK